MTCITEARRCVKADNMAFSIHRFAETTSTQDEARRLLVDKGRAKVGDVVVADVQTAGRGRFDRTWQSPPGGLYATFLVVFDPLVAIRSAVAVARALAVFGIDVRLKWPNDVLVGDAKLAGLLIESDGDRALVGIGVNLTVTPVEGATSVSDCRKKIRRGDLIMEIHRALHDETTDAELLAAYRTRSATVGRRVHVTLGDAAETIEGRAIDIDDAGRLLVDTSAGVRAVASGECTHVSERSSRDELQAPH
jgi:BirA family biotin operon repressor/biotin-[acetyl-CoA-carboxylase] ligase